MRKSLKYLRFKQLKKKVWEFCLYEFFNLKNYMMAQNLQNQLSSDKRFWIQFIQFIQILKIFRMCVILHAYTTWKSKAKIKSSQVKFAYFVFISNFFHKSSKKWNIYIGRHEDPFSAFYSTFAPHHRVIDALIAFTCYFCIFVDSYRSQPWHVSTVSFLKGEIFKMKTQIEDS